MVGPLIKLSSLWQSFQEMRNSIACIGSIVEAIPFAHDLIANLPRHIRLRGVRAEAGLYAPEVLEFFESRRLSYVVVARLVEKNPNPSALGFEMES
jgi:ABC-type bacteriocin/lantibiotic exporter with double-glycine peptidase domain